MEQTPLPPLVSDERKPLSYYMRNGLWYFTQPPDAVTGQVIPRSTVESWLSRVEEMESDRQRTQEVVQALVNMIHHRHMNHPADTTASAKYYASGGLSTVDALALAKSQLQIEPTK